MLKAVEKNGIMYFKPKRSKLLPMLLAAAVLVATLSITLPVGTSTIQKQIIPPTVSIDTTKILTTWVKSRNDKVPEHLAKSIVESSTYWGTTYNIDPLLILSLISVESRFNVFAVSSSNALGLTQVIPKWHKEKIKGSNLFDINSNIRIGTQVLYKCLEDYKVVQKALLCYNGSLNSNSLYAKNVLDTRKDLGAFLVASTYN